MAKQKSIIYNFVGEYVPSKKNLVNKTETTWDGSPSTRLNLSFGVKDRGSVQFVSCMGSSRPNGEILTYDTDGNPINIRWADRFDADIVNKIPTFRTWRTNIGTDETKVFITAYDFIEYLSTALEGYTGRIVVNGRLNLRYDSHGVLRRNYDVESVWKPRTDADGNYIEKTKLGVLVPFIYNKDSIDKADLKDSGKIYINGYVESYINRNEGNKFIPLQMVFNTKAYDMDNPKEKTKYDHRMSYIDIKAKNMQCMLWEGRVVNGAEEKPFDESCLTPTQLRSLRAGNVTLDELRPRGSIYGARTSELRLARPIESSGEYENGFVDLSLKPSEFADQIYVPTKDESVSEMEKSTATTIPKRDTRPPFADDSDDGDDELF